jgi:hypothetical protein
VSYITYDEHLKQVLRDNYAASVKREEDLRRGLLNIWQSCCDYEARGDGLGVLMMMPFWVIRGWTLLWLKRLNHKRLVRYQARAELELREVVG